MKWRWQNTKTEKRRTTKVWGGQEREWKMNMKQTKTPIEKNEKRMKRGEVITGIFISGWHCECLHVYIRIRIRMYKIYVCAYMICLNFRRLYYSTNIRRAPNDLINPTNVCVRANKRMEKGKHASKPFLSAECIITFKLFKILLTFKWRKRRNRQE